MKCTSGVYHLRDPTDDERDAQQKHKPAERPLLSGGRVACQRRPSAGAPHQHVVFVVWTVFHAQRLHDGQIRVDYGHAKKYTCGTTDERSVFDFPLFPSVLGTIK